MCTYVSRIRPSLLCPGHMHVRINRGGGTISSKVTCFTYGGRGPWAMAGIGGPRYFYKLVKQQAVAGVFSLIAHRLYFSM